MMILNFFSTLNNILWLNGKAHYIHSKFVPNIGSLAWIDETPMDTDLQPKVDYNIEVDWVEDGYSTKLIDKDGHIWVEVGCSAIKKDYFRLVKVWSPKE